MPVTFPKWTKIRDDIKAKDWSGRLLKLAEQAKKIEPLPQIPQKNFDDVHESAAGRQYQRACQWLPNKIKLFCDWVNNFKTNLAKDLASTDDYHFLSGIQSTLGQSVQIYSVIPSQWASLLSKNMKAIKRAAPASVEAKVINVQKQLALVGSGVGLITNEIKTLKQTEVYKNAVVTLNEMIKERIKNAARTHIEQKIVSEAIQKKGYITTEEVKKAKEEGEKVAEQKAKEVADKVFYKLEPEPTPEPTPEELEAKKAELQKLTNEALDLDKKIKALGATPLAVADQKFTDIEQGLKVMTSVVNILKEQYQKISKTQAISEKVTFSQEVAEKELEDIQIEKPSLSFTISSFIQSFFTFLLRFLGEK